LAHRHPLFLVHDGILKAPEISAIEIPGSLERHRGVK
jgi:hypothetical protein